MVADNGKGPTVFTLLYVHISCRYNNVIGYPTKVYYHYSPALNPKCVNLLNY